LKEVFGCKTYTKYYDSPSSSDWKQMIHETTATAAFDGPWPEAYPRMAASDEVCMVKTHDDPEDGAKAVYVVRDGFSSILSFQHYLRDLRGKNLSLQELILGKHRFGSWGSHLDAWQPLHRPNTLLLTYEGLVQKPEEQIAKLSTFCGLSPQKSWTNDFSTLHARNPGFFRKGKAGDASSEFSETQKDMFWALHGDWMQRLGYASEFPSEKALPRVRRALMNYIKLQPAEKPPVSPSPAQAITA
jgi:hypothetical protein